MLQFQNDCKRLCCALILSAVSAAFEQITQHIKGKKISFDLIDNNISKA